MHTSAKTVPSVFLIAFFICAVIVQDAGAQQNPEYEILSISVEGTITAGTTQFLKQSIEDAEKEEYDALLLTIDTPGGLVDATLDIMQGMLNASIPIITYVHPRGAIAASAGTFITLAGHVAAMAPGTTIGAAMPVTMQPGQEGQEEASEKTITFLAGHMRNIAEERGRPTEQAEQFVTENLTLGAAAAEEDGMIDVVADDIDDLLAQLDGRQVSVAGEEVTLNTANADLTEKEMTTGQRISSFISNPQVAFILLMLGIYGIFFGLSMPGTFVPEVIGAVSLILGLFGLGMFDISVLGIALIVIGVILFVVEAFTPTFGIFTTLGAVALVVGALSLPVEPMLPETWYREFIVTVLGMVAVTIGFFTLVILKVITVSRKSRVHEHFGMKGFSGRATEDLDPEGRIRIRGEWWKARSAGGERIPKESSVTVRDQEGMVLIVEKNSGE